MVTVAMNDEEFMDRNGAKNGDLRFGDSWLEGGSLGIGDSGPPFAAFRDSQNMTMLIEV